jgi:transketolase
MPGKNAGTGRGYQAMTGTIDELCINTIRTLAMDAVQQANSGHPGTPMSMAPVACSLWQRYLKYDLRTRFGPTDRFVLSIGHARVHVALLNALPSRRAPS